MGERLVGGATECASVIVEELTKFGEIGFRDSNAVPQFLIEIIVFYMHLVDRRAFAHLGAVKRQEFADRFVLAVMREALREVKLVPVDDFGGALRDTYNRRQMKYARYKELLPSKDEPLKDSLCWEFSKILFGFFEDENPATLMFLSALVADLTKVMLINAMKVEEVLSS